MLNTEEAIEGAKVYLDPTWKFLSHRAARPRPVTIPMRARMNYTQPFNGQVTKAVHSWAVPNCAPTIE
jgi:hypothetical protein